MYEKIQAGNSSFLSKSKNTSVLEKTSILIEFLNQKTNLLNPATNFTFLIWFYWIIFPFLHSTQLFTEQGGISLNSIAILEIARLTA